MVFTGRLDVLVADYVSENRVEIQLKKNVVFFSFDGRVQWRPALIKIQSNFWDARCVYYAAISFQF